MLYYKGYLGCSQLLVDFLVHVMIKLYLGVDPRLAARCGVSFFQRNTCPATHSEKAWVPTS